MLGRRGSQKRRPNRTVNLWPGAERNARIILACFIGGSGCNGFEAHKFNSRNGQVPRLGLGHAQPEGLADSGALERTRGLNQLGIDRIFDA